MGGSSTDDMVSSDTLSVASKCSLQVLYSFDEIGPDRWRELYERCSDATIFQSYEWQTAWWRNFAREGSQLYLLAAFDGGDLVGLAPLQFVDSGGHRVMRFVGQGGSDYQTFIVADEYEGVVELLLSELLARSHRHWRTQLSQIPEASRLGIAFSKLATGRSVRCRQVEVTPCPRVAIRGNEDHVRKLLNKQSLKRHEKALRRRGQITVEHLTSASDIRRHLDAFFRQHIRRWSVTKFPSRFRAARYRQFYHDLIDSFAPKHEIMLTVVAVDGDPVAYHFGLVRRGHFIWYTPTFEPTLWRAAPGEVLLKELLSKACDDGMAVFDFTRGDEFYKSRFANERHQNLDFVIEKTSGDALLANAIAGGKTLVRSIRGASQLHESYLRAQADLDGQDASALQVLKRLLARSTVHAFALARDRHEHTSVGYDVIDADLGYLLDLVERPGHELVRDRLPAAYGRLRKRQQCYVLSSAGTVVGWVWYGNPLHSKDACVAHASERARVTESFYDLEIWRIDDDSEVRVRETMHRLVEQVGKSAMLIVNEPEMRPMRAAATSAAEKWVAHFQWGRLIRLSNSA